MTASDIGLDRSSSARSEHASSQRPTQSSVARRPPFPDPAAVTDCVSAALPGRFSPFDADQWDAFEREFQAAGAEGGFSFSCTEPLTMQMHQDREELVVARLSGNDDVSGIDLFVVACGSVIA